MSSGNLPGGVTLHLYSTNAARAFLDELIPPFERATRHRVAVTNSTTQQILARVRSGETADLVIATAPGMTELAALGKIDPGSRSRLGSTCVGVGVRAGAPRPDIGSVDALRRALLAAQSIAYTTLGQSGIHFERVVKRLGIGTELAPKFRIIPGGLVGELVVRGEAELGVQMLSEILAVPGFELVGPFPPELQEVSVFETALFAGTPHADAARALAGFLATAESRRVMADKGFATP